jgi:hypothetical protein
LTDTILWARLEMSFRQPADREDVEILTPELPSAESQTYIGPNKVPELMGVRSEKPGSTFFASSATPERMERPAHSATGLKGIPAESLCALGPFD